MTLQETFAECPVRPTVDLLRKQQVANAPANGVLNAFKSIGTTLVLAMVVFVCGSAVGDETEESTNGFVSLFDGKTLDGWEGDQKFWRVEDGAIVGQTTEDNKTAKNTFLVFTKDTVDDFELRFSYRVKGGNSGIQYRSEVLSKWVVKGLQADFEDQMHEGKDKFSGMFFEENGRMFMGQRGDVVVVRSNEANAKKPRLEKIATVGDPVELEANIRRDGWNDYTIIAKGNVFIHIINGKVMSIGIDEDELNARKSGILAWQLHAGPPLKIEMKNIRLRRMP
ncbi:MAG: DUF1080 domain-containing protein [Planctomycetota bacterium]